MGKRKLRSKRSASSLPKGLPSRNSAGSDNPFEVVHRSKRPKHDVLNRTTSSNKKPTLSALARSVQQRQEAIQAARKASRSANVFEDKRIGEYNPEHSQQDKQIARLVRERSQRSKRNQKFRLDNDDDDNEHLLTHKGKTIDKLTAADHVILSDDDEDDDYGGLETDLHFGGGDSKNMASIYGHSVDMAEVYAQRKNDLDDIIMRRKIAKAERLESKHVQEEKIESMDEQYGQLAELLQFRDKEKEIREYIDNKRKGNLTEEDQEFEEWNKEMKTFQFATTKAKASDRTKTPEEISKDTADKLQELETRRLARMKGEFENDSLDDISDEEGTGAKRRKKKKDTKKLSSSLSEKVDYSDSEDEDEQPKPHFTPDGLVLVNKDGLIAKQDKQEDEDNAESSRDNDDDLPELDEGTRVRASYHALEQFDGHEAWYDGVISSVNTDPDTGKILYDITYDDGDLEEGVLPRHVKLPSEVAPEPKKKEPTEDEEELKQKRQKAKARARKEIPFVFEVPTTLDALHDLIATHASTGKDASTIIERIYKTNSVRLDRRNLERMQNFYDVLLRRFIAVGDALFESGDGGLVLERYKQLDALVKTLYFMAQDAPESASAVWGRRLGFFQNAHAKRLRDADLQAQEEDDEESAQTSAWPSVGVFLALRSIGHIFPVTDRRHPIVTPAMLLLAQMVGHTPIVSMYDLVMGVLCSGLLLEFTKEAKRVVPETLAFLAGVIRLYSPDASKTAEGCTLPSLGVAADQETFTSLRASVSRFQSSSCPQLSLEKDKMNLDEMKTAVLASVLDLVRIVARSDHLKDSVEQECFAALAESLLALQPQAKPFPLNSTLQNKVRTTIKALSQVCRTENRLRLPLQRRAELSVRDKAIKSLAPRMEDPTKYSMSKDKGKNATQTALDRTRREYKREHKAVARELRTDAVFFEAERRADQDKRDSAAKAKRQKAFSWMEGEQATMNQQVRQGGGLLSGGGIGAARAKAKTAKVGMKKGGKLR